MAKYSTFASIPIENRSWPNNVVRESPIWCSVDLRDGNQALPTPMNVGQKLSFFNLLVQVGFKEIEVGFPSASQTEYDFVRCLIEKNLIPSDVTIQVLCPAKEILIKQSMASLIGVKTAIFHVYNPISPAQRKYTFQMNREQILKMAVDGVKNIKKYQYLLGETRLCLEYSPESFSSTESDYALEVCNAVIAEWNPTVDNPMIINLPETVECAMPNVFADQIEYISQKLLNRDAVILSVHTHNDRGTGNAAAELALLAGAQRVEGTLFGNGERTGNADLVSMAINLSAQGIDSHLDFTDVLKLRSEYTRLTSMEVPPRHPYAGDLVFTAFSGAHQDAIRKGLKVRKTMDEHDQWDVPYLSIDPRDIGRQYKELIRINSQSGKGGAEWVMEQEFGIYIPKTMQKLLGDIVSATADKLQRELLPKEVYKLFEENWLNTNQPLSVKDVVQTHVDGQTQTDNVLCRASVVFNDNVYAIGDKGNGPLDAFASALKQVQNIPSFTISDFHEHSIGSGSDTDAMAYVEITDINGLKAWGCGRNSNIGLAGINAVVSAVNCLLNNVMVTC